MKQETLEEAYNRIFEYKLDRVLKAGFIAGAKWQQERSYSKEEVFNILTKFWMWSTLHTTKEHLIKWFEQFKK